MGSLGDSASATFTVNRPTVSAAVIAKSAGGAGGFIKKSGSYYVYANVTGSGSPPAGLASLTADVSAITTGQTTAALTSGSYTVGGQTYNYRSAPLTAKSTLAAGSDSFTVKVTDSAGTATTSSYSVTVDNTAPRASNIQTANVAGGTTGKPELGDAMTLTYTKAIDPDSLESSWSGASTPVIVRSSMAGPPPTTPSRCSTRRRPSCPRHHRPRPQGLRVADDHLRRPGHRIRDVLSGTASRYARHAQRGRRDGAGHRDPHWTPSATVTDPAGNAMSTGAVTESGSADKDF